MVEICVFFSICVREGTPGKVGEEIRREGEGPCSGVGR